MTISWETLSGEDVERAIATYICLEHPSSVRVRPSGGDGGIDVINTLKNGKKSVYQIKKFALNLTVGQKNQIKKYWDSICEYSKEEGFELEEWNLVMPLDPTNENREWLEQLTADAHCNIHWIGRAHIDGWAAKMPFVADYYFRDNRDAVLDIAKMMLDASRPDITSRSGLLGQLASIQGVLDSIDPNYTHAYQVIDKFDKDNLFSPSLRPGLVMSTIEKIGEGKFVQIDVIAKHAAAADISPISGKITLRADNEQRKKELSEFLDYGMPLHDFPAVVKNTGIPALILENEIEEGLISIFSWPPNRTIPISISNARNETIDIHQLTLNEGRKGIAWTGASAESLFSVSLRANYNDFALSVTVNLSLSCLNSVTPTEALRILRFLSNEAGTGFTFKIGDIRAIDFDLKMIGIDEAHILNLIRAAEALAVIDMVSSSTVLFPEEFSGAELARLVEIAEIVRVKTVKRTWISLNINWETKSPPTENSHVKYIKPLIATIGGQKHHCGYVEYHVIGMWDKNKELFAPTTEYGDTVIISYIGCINSTGMIENRIYVCPAIPLDDSSEADEND